MADNCNEAPIFNLLSRKGTSRVGNAFSRRIALVAEHQPQNGDTRGGGRNLCLRLCLVDGVFDGRFAT